MLPLPPSISVFIGCVYYICVLRSHEKRKNKKALVIYASVYLHSFIYVTYCEFVSLEH